MKPDLLEHFDFILVPSDIWDLINNWYDSDLPRGIPIFSKKQPHKAKADSETLPE
jgi:hypothetical protein